VNPYAVSKYLRDPAEIVTRLAEPPEDLSWRDAGLCAEVDPELFFPEKGGTAAPAKRVCRSCPVRAECLDYALGRDVQHGVWGGLSERERRRLKRQQTGSQVIQIREIAA
jgi:WhiB family redox-sensing transcriptional regulator